NAAAAASGARQQRSGAAPGNAPHPNATANAAPSPTEVPRGPAPVWGRGDHANAPNAPAANANLAPHPVPPNQPAREAAHGAPNAAAPNAPGAPNAPAGRDL